MDKTIIASMLAVLAIAAALTVCDKWLIKLIFIMVVSISCVAEMLVKEGPHITKTAEAVEAYCVEDNKRLKKVIETLQAQNRAQLKNCQKISDRMHKCIREKKEVELMYWR